MPPTPRPDHQQGISERCYCPQRPKARRDRLEGDEQDVGCPQRNTVKNKRRNHDHPAIWNFITVFTAYHERSDHIREGYESGVYQSIGGELELDRHCQLIRRVADHRGAMHVAIRIRRRRLGDMHTAAIIPKDEIMQAPLMAVDELRLHTVFG